MGTNLRGPTQFFTAETPRSQRFFPFTFTFTFTKNPSKNKKGWKPFSPQPLLNLNLN
jgi:hypothetical protein